MRLADAAALLQGRTPAAIARSTGQFYAGGGHIWAPDGSRWLQHGCNLGTRNAFDWYDEVLWDYRGTAVGMSSAAQRWGWGVVRLNMCATDDFSWAELSKGGTREGMRAYLQAIVDEYTSKGIVVIIAGHDRPAENPDPADIEAQMVEWWALAAAAWADNPHVWLNPFNENPGYPDARWVAINRKLCAAIRGAGNTAPIIVDAPFAGQDVGTFYGPGRRFSYQPNMLPALQAEFGNLIISIHNYGGWGAYDTTAKMAGWVRAVRGAGGTPMIGECGWTTNGQSTAGTYAANRAGAKASLSVALSEEVPCLVWHGTQGDPAAPYSLTQSGKSFRWAFPDLGVDTSDFGHAVWALTH